jgi:uncharacterized protein YukJ
MPLHQYGVLKGRAIAARREDATDTPHYQVHIAADLADFRIAVNVRSQAAPSDLLFLVDTQFQHPLTAQLGALPLGWTPLPSRPGGVALDFIRGNMFSRLDMRPLPSSQPGPDNDLSDQLEHYIARAIAEGEAPVYAFGERWGPETQRDKIFGFRPGNGVHDIHMNQGNAGRFVGDDGVWQDGALLLAFPATNQWVGIFLAFQSQAWHTDDITGHTSPDVPDPGTGPTPSPSEPDHVVRIVGALVNPLGPAPEHETVTLLNASPQAIDLAGWRVADRMNRAHSLTGTLAPGTTMVVALPPTVQLGNRGGIITLLNQQGLKVDGVAYTEQQADKEGWTIVF